VLVNVPLLILLRLRTIDAGSAALPDLLIVLGLAALLAAACDRLSQLDLGGLAVRTGMAQIGLVALAFGVGGPAALLVGWFGLTVLTLVRSSLLQCENRAPTWALVCTQAVAALASPAMVLFTLFLVAGAVAERSPWLMLALGLAVLMTGIALIDALPKQGSRIGASLSDTLALLPIWLQLALALVLAIAMPVPVFDWFRAVADAG
jgi:hydrogenase-4 component F